MLNAKKKRDLASWQTVLDSLSGTVPEASGSHYLQRLVTEKTFTNNTAALSGHASLPTLKDE